MVWDRRGRRRRPRPVPESFTAAALPASPEASPCCYCSPAHPLISAIVWRRWRIKVAESLRYYCLVHICSVDASQYKFGEALFHLSALQGASCLAATL